MLHVTKWTSKCWYQNVTIIYTVSVLFPTTYSRGEQFGHLFLFFILGHLGFMVINFIAIFPSVSEETLAHSSQYTALFERPCWLDFVISFKVISLFYKERVDRKSLHRFRFGKNNFHPLNKKIYIFSSVLFKTNELYSPIPDNHEQHPISVSSHQIQLLAWRSLWIPK